MSKNLNLTTIKFYIKRITNVKHVTLLNLPDLNIVLFVKCVYQNLIIIAYGNFIFYVRIRQCVGEKNYKFFISFLFLHGVWCLYLSIIGALSLADFLDRMGFMRMSFRIEG